MKGRPWTTKELDDLRAFYYPGTSPEKAAEHLALRGHPGRSRHAVAAQAIKLGLTARRGQQAPAVAAELHAEIVELREGLKHAWVECSRLRAESRALRAELSQLKPYPLNAAGDLQPPLPFEVV